MELYALQLNMDFQKRPSDLVKQHHSPDTLSNKDLKPCTNRQPCGRHYGSIPDNPTPSNNKFTNLKVVFLARE